MLSLIACSRYGYILSDVATSPLLQHAPEDVGACFLRAPEAGGKVGQPACYCYLTGSAGLISEVPIVGIRTERKAGSPRTWIVWLRPAVGGPVSSSFKQRQVSTS